MRLIKASIIFAWALFALSTAAHAVDMVTITVEKSPDTYFRAHYPGDSRWFISCGKASTRREMNSACTAKVIKGRMVEFKTEVNGKHYVSGECRPPGCKIKINSDRKFGFKTRPYYPDGILTVIKPKNGHIHTAHADNTFRRVGGGKPWIGCGHKNDCKGQAGSWGNHTLHATPNKGYVFDKWGGACSGNNPVCNVTLKVNRTLSATFKPDPKAVKPKPAVTVTVEPGIDRPGSDYSMSLNNTREGCRKKCAADSRCKAFTYIDKTVFGIPAGKCHLKNRVPGKKRLPQVTSGVKKG